MNNLTIKNNGNEKITIESTGPDNIKLSEQQLFYRFVDYYNDTLPCYHYKLKKENCSEVGDLISTQKFGFRCYEAGYKQALQDLKNAGLEINL